MKKIFLLLSAVFLSLSITVLFTKTTYAAHTAGYTLTQETVSGEQRYYVKYNNSKTGLFNTDYFTIDFSVLNIRNISSVVLVVDNAGSHPDVTVTLQWEYLFDELGFAMYQDAIEAENPEGPTQYIETNHDSSTQMYFKTFTALDNVRPAISGEENFVTSVDDAKPVSYFQQYLSAIDETDGNISSRIYVKTDNYTTNKAVLGTYTVVFGVKDNAQNESTLSVSITVADVTKPVIAGNTSKATISYTQTWNIANFKSTLTVTDNYATLTNTNISVKTDDYTSNKSNLGTYNVVYAVTDPSGNEGTFTKQVEVIDDIAPVFAGPTVLTKPATQVLTINEIKAQLSATDAKEGNKTAQITVFEDNYTGKGNKVGNYTITFQVSDSKGNRATHVVTVSVQDNIPPVWYIQDGVSFKIVPPATLTRQQIIDLLVATNQLSVNATTQINFIIDEYTGNETTPGNYMVSVGYADTAGNEGVHNLTIRVLEDENTNPIIVNPNEGFDFFGFVTSPMGLVVIGIVVVGAFVLLRKPTIRRRK